MDRAPDRDRITSRACPLSHCHTSPTGLLLPPSFGIRVLIVFQLAHMYAFGSLSLRTKFVLNPVGGDLKESRVAVE